VTSAELFQIGGVSEQREIQCSNCPDGRSKYTAEELAFVRGKLKPHRCHETPAKLCAGPLRPRPLSPPVIP
jgi:hypothetical protein